MAGFLYIVLQLRETKHFIVPDTLWPSSGTMEYFTSSTLSIGTLLTNYWSLFDTENWINGSNRIREHVTNCINKTMKCNTWELGYMTLKCNNCCETKKINFTCHKNSCSRCSKVACDKWVNNIRSRLPTHLQYVHITWTLPEELRPFWLSFRSNKALSILFNKAHKIILDFFQKRFGCTPWVFSILLNRSQILKVNRERDLIYTS
jgi:hypothetical protein